MKRGFRTPALPDGVGAKDGALDDLSAVRGVALVRLESLFRSNGKQHEDESEVGIL